jgi:preprotein translocase subunit SecG
MEMSALKIVLIVVEAVVSLALILIVLFQSGKEAGLSGALAGNTDTYLSKGKGANLDKILASATKWVALVWVILTLALNFV